jgi:predicted transcriptional regulator
MMQTHILAAIYAIVKENRHLPVFPKSIGDISGCDAKCIEEHFKGFEEDGFLKKKYPSFKVYTITNSGFIAAESAYHQLSQIA